MSLKNSKYDTNRWDVTAIPTENQFENSKRRLLAKKQAIDDLQNEYQLLESQALNLYKNNVVYWTLGEGFIKDMITWLDMVNKNQDSEGNKLDKRKKYREKNVFNYMSDLISKYLGVDDLVVTDIHYYGFYSEGYYINFTSHNKKWGLFIPMPEKVTLKTFQFEGESFFKLSLYVYKSEHHMSLVGATFIEEELKDIMAKALGGEENESTTNNN